MPHFLEVQIHFCYGSTHVIRFWPPTPLLPQQNLPASSTGGAPSFLLLPLCGQHSVLHYSWIYKCSEGFKLISHWQFLLAAEWNFYGTCVLPNPLHSRETASCCLVLSQVVLCLTAIACLQECRCDLVLRAPGSFGQAESAALSSFSKKSSASCRCCRMR